MPGPRGLATKEFQGHEACRIGRPFFLIAALVRTLEHRMQILVNGNPRQAPVAVSIADLLLANRLDPQAVVVEHNGHIVATEDYASTSLRADDRLEILHFVGGG
jgi:sulfur carrier protein